MQICGSASSIATRKLAGTTRVGDGVRPVGCLSLDEISLFLALTAATHNPTLMSASAGFARLPTATGAMAGLLATPSPCPPSQSRDQWHHGHVSALQLRGQPRNWPLMGNPHRVPFCTDLGLNLGRTVAGQLLVR